MISSEFTGKIKQVVSNSVCNEPMALHTTFRIGGNADCYCEVNNISELAAAVTLCRNEGVPYMIIGNGSNLLVSDNGIRGVVIKCGGDLSRITVSGTKAVAGCGASLSELCSVLRKNGLSGLEFAAGIPGSVGGGVYMNAGAYGGMLSDRIYSVTFLDSDLTIKKLPGDMLDFGYRKSVFMGNGAIILECVFMLEKDDEAEIAERMKEYNRRRTEKQPLNMPSAGSVFKRPEGYFAGKLIEDSGLMGKRIGGAEVSDKHAGFIVNAGGATAKDVTDLIDYIKKTVYDKYGVMLEEEVRVTGGK